LLIVNVSDLIYVLLIVNFIWYVDHWLSNAERRTNYSETRTKEPQVWVMWKSFWKSRYIELS